MTLSLEQHIAVTHLFVIAFQGLFKFGLYEVFKVKYSEMLGEENAYLYRTGLYLAASASAEFFADMGKLRGTLKPGSNP